METIFLYEYFVTLDLLTAVQVIALGVVGGILSGFIGSGGAFFMTPGMMNLGVPGVVAVASNITHKFGKAMVGSRKHAELGNVDKRLGAFLILTSFVGIRIAVWINSMLFESGGDGHGAGGSAAADLYISLIFVCILSVVAISMLRDAFRARTDEEGGGPSASIANFLARHHLPPYIYFRIADVRVSLWILMLVGLAGFEAFYPNEISGGMKKRAGLARAMALDPEILFFDEPSAGLDPVNAKLLDDLILELCESLGTTLVVVTHELDSIYAIADEAIFLDGKEKTVIARGPPRELVQSSGEPRVRAFLTRGGERRGDTV